jgi:hypothetical protein
VGPPCGSTCCAPQPRKAQLDVLVPKERSVGTGWMERSCSEAGFGGAVRGAARRRQLGCSRVCFKSVWPTLDEGRGRPPLGQYLSSAAKRRSSTLWCPKERLGCRLVAKVLQMGWFRGAKRGAVRLRRAPAGADSSLGLVSAAGEVSRRLEGAPLGQYLSSAANAARRSAWQRSCGLETANLA